MLWSGQRRPDKPCSNKALSLTATGGRGTSSDYRLGPNDRTRIIVFGQSTLTGEFQLDGNGVLAYPLIGALIGYHIRR